MKTKREVAAYKQISTAELEQHYVAAKKVLDAARAKLDKAKVLVNPAPKKLAIFGLSLPREYGESLEDAGWRKGAWSASVTDWGWSIYFENSKSELGDIYGEGKTLATAEKDFRKRVAKLKNNLDTIIEIVGSK